MKRIYLDYNATAPLRPEVKAAMVDAMALYGNPSSQHAEGRAARQAIETARRQVADLTGADPEGVIFTSGATEANNTVLRQAIDEGCVILMPATAHPSLLEAARHGELYTIPVTEQGLIDLTLMAQTLAQLSEKPVLLAMNWVNSETGVIQPLEQIQEVVSGYSNVWWHIDGVQAIGRFETKFLALGCHTMTVSAHKIAGPLGVGALLFRPNVDVMPLLKGGGQEKRRRSGTQATPLIAGFGVAAEIAKYEISSFQELNALQNNLENGLINIDKNIEIIGKYAQRVVNTTMFSLPHMSAEIAMMRLDLAGFALSNGAACSSGRVTASSVLLAMGYSEDQASRALRVSLGWNSKPEDIEAFLDAIRGL